MTALPAALVRTLRQQPIFEGLTTAEVAEVLEVALEREEPAGAVLFEEGDPGDALRLVLEGEVVISSHGVELARVGRHAVLGGMSLLAEREVRSATATVARAATLLKVPSRRVQRLLEAGHLGAYKVVANLARVMSRRLRAVNDQLVAAQKGAKGGRTEQLADFRRILTRWEF